MWYPSRDLDAAADYIETHGWTRFQNFRSGRACLLGAFMQVADSQMKLESLSDTLFMDTHERPDRWNDRQKSRKPVIAKLRELAAKAREEEKDWDLEDES